MPVLDEIVTNNIGTENVPEEQGPINPVVGIIYPPPEVRSILFYLLLSWTGKHYLSDFIYIPDIDVKILSTKLLVLWQEMDQSLRHVLDRMNSETQSSIFSMLVIHTMLIINIKLKTFKTAKVNQRAVFMIIKVCITNIRYTLVLSLIKSK